MGKWEPSSPPSQVVACALKRLALAREIATKLHPGSALLAPSLCTFWTDLLALFAASGGKLSALRMEGAMGKHATPRQHLRSTMRFARRTARWHGHALGPWRQASPRRHESECQKCGAVAFIETDFPGDAELIGDVRHFAHRFLRN
jgi:hypothetical protein